MGVVGTGYVGTVVAACLAHVGHQVVGLEVDERKLGLLREGRTPFYEPGLATLLTGGLDSERLRFTGDVAEAVASSDVLFLCVGTPSGQDGHADVGALADAVRVIAETVDGPKVLVTKSTVPIGSGRWVEGIVDDAQPADLRRRAPVTVVSNPEFLRQGSAVDDYLHPDRVVLGSDDPDALERVARIYEPILQQRLNGDAASRRPVLVRTTLASAETVKYASNAFLALKISFANEIANICELVGADVTDVVHAMGLDERIGARFLDAGAGWGGSCFGKDLSELIAAASDHGYDARLLRAAKSVNGWQRELVVKKVRRHLHGLRGRRVGLLGLAFKPGTDDLRDAPSLDIARALLAGGATVLAHDPVVRSVPGFPELRIAGDPYEAGERADAVVLVTEWSDYLELELGVLRDRMRGRLLLDSRNLFDPAKVRTAGLHYEGIGRANGVGPA
ncbi:MAG: UDP-glucose/GDP-mannose dehydrogenase family protein [Acidimicrobiia bacterium]|nr:UDP-glucose/GDP-mannose dehydrogenase family protein [Acidimicrobiia bacterium]